MLGIDCDVDAVGAPDLTLDRSEGSDLGQLGSIMGRSKLGLSKWLGSQNG